jgi:hypothetical protein
MAVAIESGSESHTGTTGSVSEASFSWSHVGTAPKGVVVFVFTLADAANVTSVTYGGSAVAAVSGGEAIDSAGEPARCKAFFLGSAIPSGTQTVVVNRTNNADEMYAAVMAVTAASDTEVYTAGIVLLQGDQTVAEQSVDDGSPGTNSLRCAGVYSGDTALAVGANSTTVRNIIFALAAARLVRETTVGQGSRSVGCTTAGSDDCAGVHLAIREPPAAASVIPVIMNLYRQYRG